MVGDMYELAQKEEEYLKKGVGEFSFFFLWERAQVSFAYNVPSSCRRYELLRGEQIRRRATVCGRAAPSDLLAREWAYIQVVGRMPTPSVKRSGLGSDRFPAQLERDCRFGYLRSRILSSDRLLSVFVSKPSCGAVAQRSSDVRRQCLRIPPGYGRPAANRLFTS